MSLKVLLVNTGVLPLPPEAPAGAEYHVYYLANYLAREGVIVNLISEIRSRKPFHTNLAFHSFRFRHPPLRRFSGWLVTHFVGGLHSYIKYLEVINKIKPDVIHIHGRLAARLISMIKLTKSPLVYTLHDQSPYTGHYHGVEQMIRKWAYLLNEYQTVRKVDHIIAVSRQIYLELTKWLGINENKVTYIPNGVDTEYFKPALYKKPYILFVGRLTRRKGVDLLLQAYAKIAYKYLYAKLIIVGEGEQKKYLKRLAKKLNIHDRVLFLHNISRSTLRALYAKALIFVLPSIGEGLSLSLLEAMSSGCAVIATKISGATDVINNYENGVFVNVDKDEMYSALEQLIENPKLANELGLRARKHITRNYSWEAITKKTINIYKKLLDTTTLH